LVTASCTILYARSGCDQSCLTNYSVQKKYTSYHTNNDQRDRQLDSAQKQKKRANKNKSSKRRHPFFNDSKWSVQRLWSYLAEHDGVDTAAVIEAIHDVLIKTLMGSASHITPRVQRADIGWDQCFEVFGVDLLLDRNLKPWLLEVNLLPSLSSSSPLDKRIKSTLMCDVFHCIGIEPVDIQRRRARRTESDSAEDTQSTAASTASSLDPDDEDSQRMLLREICDQWQRRGNLRLIFPRIFNVEQYRTLHEAATRNDHLLWGFLALPVAEKQAILRSKLHRNLSTLWTDDRSHPPLLLPSETESNTTVSSPYFAQSESTKSAASSSPSPLRKIAGNTKRKKVKNKKPPPSASMPCSLLSSSSNSMSSGSATSSALSSGRLYARSPQRKALPISTNNIRFAEGGDTAQSRH